MHQRKVETENRCVCVSGLRPLSDQWAAGCWLFMEARLSRQKQEQEEQQQRQAVLMEARLHSLAEERQRTENTRSYGRGEGSSVASHSPKKVKPAKADGASLPRLDFSGKDSKRVQSHPDCGGKAKQKKNKNNIREGVGVDEVSGQLGR